MNKIVMFIGGFVVLIFGVMLVLRFWGSVVIVVQGIAPMVVTVAGLVLMFAASIKK